MNLLNYKNNIYRMFIAWAMAFTFAACQKDDSAKEYGDSLIYMPQSVNFSMGSNAIYPVPGSSNGISPTGMNYIVDEQSNKTKILLGASLSGTAKGAFSVDVKANTDTLEQLLKQGTLGTDYKALPVTKYSLPNRLDVPENGAATFYLEVDNSVITDPDNFGKHLVVAVQIANPSRYTLDQKRATTLVDINIAGLFPSANTTSEINVTPGATITISGQNLDKVTALKFTNGETALSILAQSANSLQVKVPEMEGISRSTIDLVTPFGTTKSAFEMVNLNLALQVFTDAYGANTGANKDGDDYGSSQSISTSVFKRGTSSLAIKYAANNYSPGGLVNTVGFEDKGYNYITFWAKGTTSGAGDEGIQMALMGDGMPDGYGNDFAGVGIIVTNEWTYYKIPIGKGSGRPMWSKGTTFRKFGWRLNNWNVPQDETIYFDDILFVK
ncbi:BT_3987 domain-containing protein [Sphingobacterium sp. 2149]|uniref:DUF1735 domain-containing protein n=1 Tax=Sphingobacterium sp. 2149 TaxID=2817763 RepID=UPI001AE58402|nr:DUF1735 domain-containing protein [Sphingobacterium sp. 2149]MDR6735584.1 hypothetical protein [Sphingobacterium sp. 2149]